VCSLSDSITGKAFMLCYGQDDGVIGPWTLSREIKGTPIHNYHKHTYYTRLRLDSCCTIATMHYTFYIIHSGFCTVYRVQNYRKCMLKLTAKCPIPLGHVPCRQTDKADDTESLTYVKTEVVMNDVYCGCGSMYGKIPT